MSENKPVSLSPLSAIFGVLGRNLMLRGLLELVIGILLLCSPVKTVRLLTMFIGVLLVIDGVVMFIAYLRTGSSGRVWMLINAIALVIFGAITVCSPLLMDQLWIIMLGAWHIVSALEELCGGGWRRPMGIFSGVLALAIGVIFIALPFVGLTYVVLITGIVLVASGIFTLLAGWDLRAAGKRS